MPSSWKWKSIGTLVLILAALYVLAPSILNLKEEEPNKEGEVTTSFWQGIFPKRGINLGLDLRGGMYLEMDVKLQEALKNRVDILLGEIERLAPADKFPGFKLNRIYSHNRIHIRAQVSPDNRAAFLELMKENFGDIFEPVGITSDSTSTPDSSAQPAPTTPTPETTEAPTAASQAQVDVNGDNTLEFKLTDSYVAYIHEMTLKQAEEAVRNRIDRYGVAEASIERQGEDRIIIELPGVKNPDRVIDIIRKTGLLEFRLVDDSMDQATLSKLIADVREKNKVPEGFSKEIADQVNQYLQGKIPDDSEIAFHVERDPVTKEVINGVPYLIKKRADVTGYMLRNAQVGISDNEPHVSLSFNKLGTKNFGDLTKVNIGKKLAIVLDGMVTTAPVIQSAILNGEAQITLGYGNYDSLLHEAEDLALLLREGALPASLTIATKTLIGPSLGYDSIHKGLMSVLIAAVVIIIFMGIYYKLGGILADFALIINALFIFAILSIFQASLTLPGIAGIVLTIGMAVDANVIIFERMKEEMRLGKTAKAIIEGGYEHAMSAIIDSNLTTLIAGIVLYQFGTGPIKGFAATLMIGIVTTMFTAVVFTRLVYDYFIFKRKIKKVII